MAVRLLAFDIDGTLTDGRTTWGGPERGWCQIYSVRDGEAILRMVAAGLMVVPLSRNRTQCARLRMEHLRLDTRWTGVSDKLTALTEIVEQHAVSLAEIAFVGDGKDDAVVAKEVGLGLAVADAHPATRAAADRILAAAGGAHVMEEIEALLEGLHP